MNSILVVGVCTNSWRLC